MNTHTGDSNALIRRDRVFDFLQSPYVENPDVDQGIILYMEDVNKTFDGFRAISNLNFYVERGELRCVIGANGAGKTTMMDIITGKTRADTGVVWFGRNTNLQQLSEAEIALAGIGRKFQKPTVFDVLTVKENLELAMAGDKTVRWTLRCQLRPEDLNEIERVANIIGLQDQLRSAGGSLSHGQKQWLEIGMLLIQRPQLLLIDEPVAGMTHQEMEKTGELLLQLAGDHTLVVVEHDMEFVRSIAARVTVLNQGTVMAEGSMDEIQSNADVRRVYLGDDQDT
ncbi:MAG: urea ABC transporter ATP-binding protein UrtD [Gammaproteobacteria bacterium]|nr:urea ABC transporter ATP-binding protein UrtD [Gammaproteobacteria bacterium]